MHACRSTLEDPTEVVDEVAVHWERIELLQIQRYSEWRQALVNKDLELGRAVQALLLPPSLTGQRGGWDYRIIYQPFGAMSGDWIQTHTPDATGQRTLSVFALGDVIGKGPSAALITSAIASAWSRLKVEGDAVAKVRDFVSSMNDTIVTLFKGSQYTTMSLALLIDGTAYLACFAAPPWIIVNTRNRTIRKVRVKPANSIGLSTFRSTFDLLEVPLTPGDVLVAYTDGVMEGFACYQRLTGLVKEGLKDDETVFAQLESLARSAGETSVHPDDFSMLMLRRAA